MAARQRQPAGPAAHAITCALAGGLIRAPLPCLHLQSSAVASRLNSTDHFPEPKHRSVERGRQLLQTGSACMAWAPTGHPAHMALLAPTLPFSSCRVTSSAKEHSRLAVSAGMVRGLTSSTAREPRMQPSLDTWRRRQGGRQGA